MKSLKKIKLCSIVISILFLEACSVQKPIYVGLYVDNSDTHEAIETLLVLNNVDSLQTIDSTDNILDSTSNDVFQNHKATFDTITSNKIIVENQPVDSVNLMYLSRLTNKKNDSANLLNGELSKLQKQQNVAPDTVYIVKEVIKTIPVNNTATDTVTSERLKAQNDSIKLLQNQITVFQKQQNVTPDTVYIKKEVIKTIPVNNTVTDTVTSERLKEQNDSIKLLQNQITVFQKQQNVTPDTVSIKKEVIKTISVNNTVTDTVTSERLKEQNDSIKLLQNQITVFQKQKNVTPDTVYIEKEVIKTISVNKSSNIDTITIVVYYQMGAITPIGSDSILNELMNLIETKNVQKLIISGYTDISGNKHINKVITDKRISYFTEKLLPIFSIEKIYIQNYADTFASNSVIENERKLVFTIISKK